MSSIFMFYGPWESSALLFAQQTISEGSDKVEEVLASEVSKVTRANGSGPSLPKGKWVRDKDLNDLLQILARKIGYNYFSNPKLEQTVTGHYMGSDTLQEIRAICTMYGLTLYEKQKTIYALTKEQVSMLPKKELIYQLKYLRGSSKEDEKKLIELIKPILTDQGSVVYEPKTYTIIVTDNDYTLQAVEKKLQAIDHPKGQVVIDVKVLRINNQVLKQFGVDWSGTFGGNGLTLGVSAYGPLDQIFRSVPFFGNAAGAVQDTAEAVSNVAGAVSGNVPQTVGGGHSSAAASQGIILSPIQLQVALKAMNENNIAKTERNPKSVVEDNELLHFVVKDKIPIITQTVSQTTGTNNISTEVRYQIDPEENEREDSIKTEVGLEVKVKPTILPDNTIRLEVVPQVGTIVGFEEASAGVKGIVNHYPIVNVAGIDSKARIPDGFSLVLTGYYHMEDRTVDKRIPFLGDIPVIGYAFRAEEKQRVRSDLIFIITAKVYDAASHIQTVEQYERMLQHELGKQASRVSEQEVEEQRPTTLGDKLKKIWPFKRKERMESYSNREEVPRVVTPEEKEQEKIREMMVRRAIPVQ